MIIIVLLLSAIYILYLSARYVLFGTDYSDLYIHSIGGDEDADKIYSLKGKIEINILKKGKPFSDQHVLSLEGKAKLDSWKEQNKQNVANMSKLHEISKQISQYMENSNSTKYMQNMFKKVAPSEEAFIAYEEFNKLLLSQDFKTFDSYYNIFKWIMDNYETKLVAGFLPFAYTRDTLIELFKNLTQVIPTLKKSDSELFNITFDVFLHYVEFINILETDRFTNVQDLNGINLRIKETIVAIRSYIRLINKKHKEYYNKSFNAPELTKYTWLYNTLQRREFPNVILEQCVSPNFKAYIIGCDGAIIKSGLFGSNKLPARFYVISGDVGLLFYMTQEEGFSFNTNYVVHLKKGTEVAYYQDNTMTLTYTDLENKKIKLNMKGNTKSDSDALVNAIQDAIKVGNK